jgi:hypothetical protein
MENFYLVQKKITVTGPRSEINSLMIYLKNEVPTVRVIKSSPHFPFWESIKDLYLVVCGEELEETVRKISSRLESSSIYRGWIDFSQIFYPIAPALT